MVMMGKGADMIGLHDLNIANQLRLFMIGGHRSAEAVSRPTLNTAIFFRILNHDLIES